MKLLWLFSQCSLALLTKDLESLVDTGLRQDGLIGDGVGWCSGFDKGGNIINNIDVGVCNAVKFIGANN